MTVPSNPASGYPASAPRSRPTTVTVASYLLYFVAAVQLISALAVFATSGTIRDAAADAVRGTDAEGAEAFVVGVLIAGGVISLVIGIGFALLAYFDSRGKNPARITTWVVGGLSLCCLGGGLGSNALFSGMESGTTTTGPSQDEVQQRINDALPGWYSPLTTTLTVLALLAILGAVILLALPASNDFFRKPTAGGWDPNYQQAYGQPPYPGQPYPGQSYPGQPGNGPEQPPYPPYPGQQGQPGQPAPGLPPYPGQTPPGSDPYAPPPSPGYGNPPSPGYGTPPQSPGYETPPPPPGGDDRPPKPPTDPA